MHCARMITYKIYLLVACVLMSMFLWQPTSFGKDLSEEELKALIMDTLKKNPDIVLDVLRENSEAVLEIAQQGNAQRKRRALISQWLQDIREPKNIETGTAPYLGNPSAPVTLVAFSDFTCAYCRQAEESLQTLLSKYNQEVRFVFMPLPNEENPLSIMAAKYGLAAFQQDKLKAWQYYRAIFANAQSLEVGGENLLREMAASAGLDLKKLAQDAKGSQVQELLNAARKESVRLGVQGTPYFFVNDLVIRGAMQKEIFEEAIQMALKKK